MSKKDKLREIIQLIRPLIARLNYSFWANALKLKGNNGNGVDEAKEILKNFQKLSINIRLIYDNINLENLLTLEELELAKNFFSKGNNFFKRIGNDPQIL